MTKQRDITSPQRQDPPALALTIPEFCRSHGISQAFYYELQKDGRGPRTMRVGRRRLISVEEAQRWREKRTVTA
jgi:predicted DNA-binding transcriptional regulator AlpA